MKKLIYILAIITISSTFTSCTVDELEPAKKPTENSILAKDGDIDPPIIIIKP